MGALPSPRLRWTATALAAVLLGLPSCNAIDVVIGRHAKLSKMVPGGSIATGALECWLTIEFNRYPKDADLRDVRVRFTSIALDAPAEFDWRYISQHDKIAAGNAFGSGYHEAEMTLPTQPPPLGKPTKVRFPLSARRVIEQAPSTLFLEAELYWGGEKQHTLRKTIEHVYSRGNGLF